jgi:hypothetical protein
MDSFWHKAAQQSRSQDRCDVIQAEFRAEPRERRSIRRESAPSDSPLLPTDDLLRLRLAEELDYARRMLDVMGDELSSDGLVVARHTEALQSVDIIGQMLGHIAGIVRSSDPKGAVERIGMCELKGRLQRKAIG